MILTIDIGNTNIVIGCIEKEKIHFISRLETDKNKTEDEYAISFKNLISLYGISSDDIQGCIISSVVPQLTTIQKQALKRATGKNPVVVDCNIKSDLEIKIDNPQQLGSDLLVASVAAINKYKAPIIIFDMGTATTVSVIDKSGALIGGMLMPGVKISLEALSLRTSQLPSISLEAPKNIIGTNTIDCMQSGIINGNAAMMDGIIERINEQLGETATVLATGGLSSMIVPHCKHNIILDTNLLLRGLSVLHEKNSDK